jgi:formylglycine-generating enzyme required for sulfatase activity
MILDDRLALPPDTVLLGEFSIVGVIGAGGFGITYEADDVALETVVAIKEYYPAAIGSRDAGLSVRPSSRQQSDLFEWGRSRFLEEARMLARFKHPGIVRVTRVFEANSTAYMVMEFERGQSFEDWLQSLGRPPTQEELDHIADRVLDALATLHAQNLLHRDIAPDNVIIRSSGDPVLLDFGAARHAVVERTRTVAGIVKSGYSPQEQYSSDGRLQGPWTDLYAFGATLYRAVAGKPPVDAPSRVDSDPLVPARQAGAGRYRPSFLEAIDACLEVKPSERPRSAAELRSLLLEAPVVPRKRRWPMLAAAALVAVVGASAGWYLTQQDASPGADPAQVGSAPAAPPDAKTPAPERHAEQQAPERPSPAPSPAPEKPPETPAATVPEKAAPAAPEKAAPAAPVDPAAKAPGDREAEPPPRTAFRDCDACPEMVVVPAGDFMMGSPEHEPGRLEFEGPLHKVSFPTAFAVARDATTRDQFKAFVDATGYRFGETCQTQSDTGWVEKQGSFLAPPGFEQGGDHPAVCVSWEDANAYARWLSESTGKRYRLPTEAEREYVARAGTTTPYWWGSGVTPEQANFDTRPRPSSSGGAAPTDRQANAGGAPGRTVPVHKGPANPWGLRHVHGNVAEWVQDCWDPDYRRAPADGTALLGGDCSQRVLRGGAWSSWPEDIRAAYREMSPPADRFATVGFRVARSLGND